MPRPNERQIAAAAQILSSDWDADGSKAAGGADAYHQWAAGIADMIIHEPPPETLVEYIGVLETQLGLSPSSLAARTRWSSLLSAAVKAQADDPR